MSSRTALVFVLTLVCVPIHAGTSAVYGNLPLTFEANRGQTDERVQFLARGSRYSVFLTPTEAVLSLNADRCSSAVVRMKLAGANPHPQLAGLDRQEGLSHYFIGADPAHWQRNVPGYARVRYEAVYPGIDLIYHGEQRQLEYDLVVAPHADPNRIAITFDGVEQLSIDVDGNLVLATSAGDIVQKKPIVYQEAAGQHVSVDGAYRLLDARSVGFEIATYDPAEPLVIDPVVNYATYLGGAGNDSAKALAVGSDGSVYVTGATSSVNFPTGGAGTIQAANNGTPDVFVTKLNAAGTAILYSTYLGGSGAETGYAIAVDGNGIAYITGETDSPTVVTAYNKPFPRVAAIQMNYGLGGDAFFTKISADGSALLYSTYYGNTGGERGYGVAVDSAGAAYFTGSTGSTNFPVTAGAAQGTAGSCCNYDAFVVKLDAAGVRVYSTFVGGNGSEFSQAGGGIAVDSSGNAYVAGTTGSTNFPGVNASSFQPTNGGGFNDAFVAKLNAAGTAFVYSSYLGGSGYDSIFGIAVDAAGSAYVTGYTDSTNFPTVSPYQATRNGFGDDAFVAKINPAGTALVYSTYFGGSGGDIAYDIAVDSHGRAFVTGATGSSNFPTVAPVQAYFGQSAMFVSEFNPAGSALLFSTYYGGTNGSQIGYGIGLDQAGGVYVTGETSSTSFPTVNAVQPAFAGGGTDAFIVKMTVPVEPAAPTGVIATAQPASNVIVNWNAVPGATSYEVLRQCKGDFFPFSTSVGAATTFNDTSTTSSAAYVYRVRAVNGVGPSFDSNQDLATTVAFTDDPIAAGVVVKAVHQEQLLTAVNAVRVCGGLFAVLYTYTAAPLPGTPVRSYHITTLRQYLDEALTALALPISGYANTAAVGTIIRAVDIDELRMRVK